jgi:hypothetical protein
MCSTAAARGACFVSYRVIEDNFVSAVHLYRRVCIARDSVSTKALRARLAMWQCDFLQVLQLRCFGFISAVKTHI